MPLMPSSTRRRWASVVLSLAALVPLAACGTGDDAVAEDEPLRLVTTTAVLGDVVSDVAGNDVSVTVVIDRDQDPHEFSPSAADVSLLAEADVVFANGLSLEAGLEDSLAAIEADGTPVIRLAELVDPIPFAGAAAVTEGLDPHFWHDPIRMQAAVDLIASALSELDPDASATWHGNADQVNAGILETHAEVERILGVIETDGRKLVTNHDSMSYFAQRYGFDVVAAIIPGGTTIGAPSAADLSEVVEALRATGVRAIFAETTQPDTLATAVAAELGHDVDVVALYTGGLGPADEPAGTYRGMLIENARRIATALAG